MHWYDRSVLHGRSALLFCITVPLAVGMLTYAATMMWWRWTNPYLEVATSIHLGLHEDNSSIETEIPLTNQGGQPLELYDFSVSCPACFTLLHRAANGPLAAKRITVPPGAGTTLTARITVSGSPADPFRGFITFRTNDPRYPEVEVRLTATIRGRIRSLPGEINFGLIERGKPSKRTIVLIDTQEPSDRHLAGVRCIDSEFLTVQPILVSNEPAEPGELAAKRPLGRYEVEVSPRAPVGTLEAHLEVLEENAPKARLVIPVRAQIAPPVESIPSQIVLPRFREGVPTFQAEWLCRSPWNQPIEVSLLTAPPAFTITPLGDTSVTPSSKRFRVEWNQPRGGATPRHSVELVFRLRRGDIEETIRVPVRFQEMLP